MSIALVVVHKTLGGHTWSNTHGISLGAGATLGVPTDAELTGVGAADVYTNANTSTTPTSLIGAIVAFERYLHRPDVQFTNVLITDGKRNPPGGGASQYATVGLANFAGLLPGTAPLGETIVPGAVSWLIHRNVTGFGRKPGRLMIRAAFLDVNIQVGGARMLSLTSTNPADYATLLATAQAKLQPWLTGGSGSGGFYGLPIYMTEKNHIAAPTVPVGQLVNMIPVTGFTSVGPIIRQVQRGRKRKKATTTV